MYIKRKKQRKRKGDYPSFSFSKKNQDVRKEKEAKEEKRRVR